MTVRSAWLLNASTATPAQNRADTRLSPLGTFTPAATDALTSRSGLIPGPGTGPCALTMSGMNATVGIGRGVVQGTSSQGAYPVVVTGADVTTIANGHASLSRIDTLWLIALDTLVDSSGSTLARVEYTQGTPGSGSAPTAPAAGTAYLRLWDITVPAGASSGSVPTWVASGLLADKRTYSTAVGGINPDGATAGAYAGQYRDGGTTTGLERYSGSAWESRLYLATSGRVVIGSDVELYRDSANVLRTPDALTVDGNLSAGNLNSGAWTTYVPTWTASGTAPAIGTGTRSGWYQRIGKTVLVNISFTMGSTTTFGTGTYSIGLPLTSVNTAGRGWTGSAVAVDSGSTVYTGTAFIGPNANSCLVYTPTGAGGSSPSQWAATNPHTWALNDAFFISLAYEIP
jgi:hypothetical protein